MFAAQQRAIDAHPDKEFYNLNIDGGAMWARRLIDPMLAEESDDRRYRESARRRRDTPRPRGGADARRAWRRPQADAERLGVELVKGHFGPARVRVGDGRRRRRAADRDRARGRRRAVPDGQPPRPRRSTLDGLPDTRSYSLVGERPRDGAYRIAVKRLPDSRGGSEFMHTLAPGAELEVSAPRSHFELQHGRPEYLLIAGGIGITPIVGMAEALARAGAGLPRCSTPRAATTRWCCATSCASCAATGCRPFARRAHRPRRGDRRPAPGRRAVRVRAARAARGGAGRLARARAAAPTGCASRRSPPPGATRPRRSTCDVRDHGDREVDVPRDRTLLAALDDAGVEVMSDCLRGECGLCTVTVLERRTRDLDHRDVFLVRGRAGGRRRAVRVRVPRGRRHASTIDTGFRAEVTPGGG